MCDEWAEELVMITCDVGNPGSVLAHAKYATNYVAVALFPTPFVLLYLPPVDDVTN